MTLHSNRVWWQLPHCIKVCLWQTYWKMCYHLKKTRFLGSISKHFSLSDNFYYSLLICNLIESPCSWQVFVSIFQYVRACLHTDSPSSCLEKKPTNSWKRHSLCDTVLSYERNRWKFEHVVRNSMKNEIWSIYNDKYFEVWTFYA